MQHTLCDGKAEAAKYGAYAILQNKLLCTTGAPGKALRAQLKTLHEFMTKDNMKTRICEHLKNRVAQHMK